MSGIDALLYATRNNSQERIRRFYHRILQTGARSMTGIGRDRAAIYPRADFRYGWSDPQTSPRA
jgi:hypothetical protein